MNQRKSLIAYLLKHKWINQAQAKQEGINRLSALIHRLRSQGYPIIFVDTGNDSGYLLDWGFHDLLQSQLRTGQTMPRKKANG